MATYVQNALYRVENLPKMTTDALHLIQQLDEQACSAEEQIEVLEQSVSADREQFKLNQLLNTIDELSEKKVQLAVSNYDLINQHVKLLDMDIELLEISIVKQTGNINLILEQTTSSNNLSGVKVSKRKRSSSIGAIGASAGEIESLREVEQNEPVYCSCRRIAFGDMIACDNESCAIEWFHYPCVGLTKMPRNTWYCPSCKTKD